MKTLNFVSMMSVAVALVLPAFAQAQDFGAPGPGPTRAFLGIPLPQQWNGVRPAPGASIPQNRPTAAVHTTVLIRDTARTVTAPQGPLQPAIVAVVPARMADVRPARRDHVLTDNVV